MSTIAGSCSESASQQLLELGLEKQQHRAEADQQQLAKQQIEQQRVSAGENTTQQTLNIAESHLGLNINTFA